MSKTVTLTIESVNGGISPTFFGQNRGEYTYAIGIDPDFPISTNASSFKTSGTIMPTQFSSFATSGTLASSVISIITIPQIQKVYAVTTGGKLISYDNALANETVIGTVAGSNASFAIYYNNYIYIIGTGAGKDDVSRYGPLSNSPTLVDNVWKGVTLGSQAALTNTTYPTIANVQMPNHAAYAHIDGALYFCDFATGKGLIHKIKTKQTTDAGDTNDGSSYGVLILPVGYIPTAITGYSEDIVVSEMLNQGSSLSAGQGQVIFWDTVNNTFYSTVQIPDQVVSALSTINNDIYIFSGPLSTGFRVSRFIGGRSTEDVAFFEEGSPPFCGAVDSIGRRLIFGSYLSSGDTLGPAAIVYSFGSKTGKIKNVLHCPYRASSTGTNPNVTALKYAQPSNQFARPIFAWHDDSAQGIDRFSSSKDFSTGNSIWRGPVWQIGKKFIVKSVLIPLNASVDSGTNIVPTIFIDSASSSIALTTINTTAFNGKMYAFYKNPKLDGSSDVNGLFNLFLQLAWTGGTSAVSVALPIEVVIEIYDDQPTR